MVNADTLSRMTVVAFRKRAVRNVVLIDEQFPNLDQALSAIGEGGDLTLRFKEWDTARKLYKEFHDQHLLCDVANTQDDWRDKLSSRISESDLIILDLHLAEGGDSTDSIDLLRSLAGSPTFNLVVVYTRDTDLPTVAYRIAGSLRGKPAGEAENELETEFPEVFDKLDEYECPEIEMVDAFLLDRRPDDKSSGTFFGNVMKEHQSLGNHKNALFSKLAVRLLKDKYASVPKEEQRFLVAADFKAGNPWMVFENVFVVVANKRATPPSEVIPVLETAIVEWNPGIVRTLVAEIQNTMSRRGYAFGESLSSDLQTQIGWLWHATSSGGGTNASDAVKILLNRMLLGLRKNLLSDEGLSAFTTKCLADIPVHGDVDKQIEEVKGWCGQASQEKISPNGVLHALNAYQSSEPFVGEFITTGTVMFSHDSTGKRWWACVEPACSTVPSQAPEDSQFIQCQLLELFKETDDADKIVSNASKSKHLFVEFDGQREYLSVVNKYDQPVVRTAYVPKNQQIELKGQQYKVTLLFPDLKDAKPKLIDRPMQIVAQLHEPYANRLLHLSGHHLSRIGLDFVDRPQSPDAASEGTD